MKFLHPLCFLFVGVICFVTAELMEMFKVVTTEYGSVKGVLKQTIFGRDYVSFQGIPYMKPPLGKLRFKAPETPDSWSEVFDATKGSSEYSQFNYFEQKLEGQEDAGVINVYTPSVNAHPLMPVLVWIHGGGFLVSDSS
jgi:cholinesterase